MRKTAPLLILFLLWTSLLAAKPIRLNIADTTVSRNSQFALAVRADSSLSGLEVYSFQLQMSYNESYLEFLGVDNQATLAAGLQVSANSYNGVIRLAAAGSSAPLSGKGILIKLKFKAKSNGYSYLSFTEAKNNLLNEGSPSLILENGSVSIVNPPALSFNPNSALLAIGESISCSVSGGKAPYSWSLSDSSLASLSEKGVLRAKKAGQLYLVAQDQVGFRDSSALFTIRAAELSLPDSSAYTNSEILLPLKIGALDSLGAFSGALELECPSARLKFLGILTENCLLQGAQVSAGWQNERLRVAFASSTPLQGRGVLLYLRFKALASGPLNLAVATLNENLPLKCKSGYLAVVNPQPLTVNPPSQPLFSGERYQFSAQGGIKPYSWSLSDTTLASISPQGELLAKKGGRLTINLLDALGNRGELANLTLYDFRCSFPDTSLPRGRKIALPLMVSGQKSNALISSVDLTLAVDSNLFRFKEVRALPGWLVSSKLQGTQLQVAAAGEPILLGTAPLLTIGLEHKASSNINHYATLYLGQLRLDDGRLTTYSKNSSLFSRDTLSAPFALQAGQSGSNVELSWQYAGAEPSRFQVERKDGERLSPYLFRRIANAEQKLFRDGGLKAQVYTYRVATCNNLLSSTYSNEVELLYKLGLEQAPGAKLALLANYPNPFNPETQIRYQLPSRTLVQVRVYNLQGALIKTLFEGVQAPGEHQLLFNGQGLESGLYLYRLETAQQSLSGKMLLVK